MVRLAKKLNIVQKLKAFTIVAKHITDKTRKRDNKTDYFLLELTNHAQAITVTQYASVNFDQATKAYLDKEKFAKQDSTYDVVLVAANSMHALRSAYPNYFADSKGFLVYLNKLLPSELPVST